MELQQLGCKAIFQELVSSKIQHVIPTHCETTCAVAFLAHSISHYSNTCNLVHWLVIKLISIGHACLMLS